MFPDLSKFQSSQETLCHREVAWCSAVSEPHLRAANILASKKERAILTLSLFLVSTKKSSRTKRNNGLCREVALRSLRKLFLGACPFMDLWFSSRLRFKINFAKGKSLHCAWYLLLPRLFGISTKCLS